MVADGGGVLPIWMPTGVRSGVSGARASETTTRRVIKSIDKQLLRRGPRGAGGGSGRGCGMPAPLLTAHSEKEPAAGNYTLRVSLVTGDTQDACPLAMGGRVPRCPPAAARDPSPDLIHGKRVTGRSTPGRASDARSDRAPSRETPKTPTRKRRSQLDPPRRALNWPHHPADKFPARRPTNQVVERWIGANPDLAVRAERPAPPG